MKIEKIKLPEKTFGIETALLIVFVPLLVTVLLIIVSVNMLLLPRFEDYKVMVGQEKSLEMQRQSLVSRRNYLLSIDQVELKKEADFVINALLPQKNSYLLVGTVGKIANKYGYQIDSFLINPGEVVNKEEEKVVVKGVASIPISLTIIGPSSQYLEFINGLELSLPVLSVDKFEMRREGEVARMVLIISAYYVEEITDFDINKLTLADLTLTKEESDLITKINQFTVQESSGEIESGFNTTKEFVKYDRADPFNL